MMSRALIGTCAVLAVLCLVQWSTLGRLKADLLTADARAYRAALVDLQDRRDEIERAITWLDSYMRSEPLQGHPAGLCNSDPPDVGAIGRWVLDVYLDARTEGASEADARRRVVEMMRAGS